MDLAPGWQIRCPKCGKTKPLGQTGAIRLGAWSRGKRTLAFCRDCRRLCWEIIERSTKPEKGPSLAEL
jgi:hypothetical protein